MKNDSGITLISLLIYVILMIVVIGIMSTILNDFYGNSQNMYAGVNKLINYNKFNTYFLKEVKKYGNKVDTISMDGEIPYILFASGNSFSLNNKKIYYNDIEICKDVQDINWEFR